MATIAFVQNKLGRTDGVSLEVDKWRAVLEGMGHMVHYLAGNEEVPGIEVIPELYLEHPAINKILRNATVAFEDYDNEAALLADIEEQAQIIEGKLRQKIDELGIELLIPNNLLSVGYNVPAMPALYRVIESGVPAIVHSHDFYFEDSGETEATGPGVLDLFERHAPPPLPNVRHVVINRLAQKALADRKGIEARVVPNVFDFEQPAWEADDYNADFRAACGLHADDIVLLQATRVLDRKGIELAIDLAAKMNTPACRQQLQAQPLYDGRQFGSDSRIVLLCVGYIEQFGITGSYVDNLKAKAEELGVDLRFVGDQVKHSRGQGDNGEKIYSLWDSYVHADAVTYPSLWEGWGNQFIEAVFARLPVVVYEYPVWVADLAQANFTVASLGAEHQRDARNLATVSEERVAAACDDLMRWLIDADERRQATEHNLAVGKERYSYTTLGGIVGELMRDVGFA